MKATKTDIERILAGLMNCPHRLAAAVARTDEARLHVKRDPKTWSPHDVLSHIRSCADVWTYSIYAMLAENEPVLPDINERKWARVTRYAELPFSDSLHVFLLQRSSFMQVLKDLPFESWERSALIFGRKHTVFTQARRMAKHEAEHCEQIESLLK